MSESSGNTDRGQSGRLDRPVLEISGLKVYFNSGKNFVRAVDGISLEIGRGEVLGLVGESGCGKSTLARTALKLIRPNSGSIKICGEEVSHLSERQMRQFRKKIQIVFQDPSSSLDPRMKVRDIISEPIVNFQLARRKSRDLEAAVENLLKSVGLDPSFADRYPNEFSGGQRQRIGIARALAPKPEIIIADEPISALDVSIQAQILNLLNRLRRQSGIALMFISHDLRAVEYISDRIAVMYLGRLVEIGPSKRVYSEPLMPYTRGLISALPVPDPEVERKRKRYILQGETPSPADPPSGCRFRTRCQFAIEECSKREPTLSEIRPSHFAACLRINAENPDIEENQKRGLGAIGA
jgi:oligopeptide/dipeptide ABC transporter ATP-binding protein